jgi:hypothetical protein
MKKILICRSYSKKIGVTSINRVISGDLMVKHDSFRQKNAQNVTSHSISGIIAVFPAGHSELVFQASSENHCIHA